MSFRFTIGKKIGTGFGVLILFIIMVFGGTFLAVHDGIQTFKELDNTSNQLINVLTPSKEYVVALKSLTIESRQLASQWVNDQSRNDVEHKLRLKDIINQAIPNKISQLEEISANWTDTKDIDYLKETKAEFELVFNDYHDIMDLLPDISSYDDPLSLFSARMLVDQNGTISENINNINNNLDSLKISLVNK